MLSAATELPSTVADVVPLTAPELAVIVVLPSPAPVTTPTELTRAIVGLDDVQWAVPLMFCCVPSSKLPFATNCWEVASGTVAPAGVTEIENRFAFDTVSAETELLIVPSEAEMLVEPGDTASAKPCVPGEELTVAVADWVEFHVTSDVMSGEV